MQANSSGHAHIVACFNYILHRMFTADIPKCLKFAKYFEVHYTQLTFKNPASYIWDGRTTILQMLHFIYIFSTNISTENFKHAAHSLFFSSKCRLFHNATLFGSCIINILRTGCAKI